MFERMMWQATRGLWKASEGAFILHEFLEAAGDWMEDRYGPLKAQEPRSFREHYDRVIGGGVEWE